MKLYSTFAGAKRAANGKPLVRLLDDPTELWIVVDKLHTDVMVFTTNGPNSRSYENAGSTTLFDIASKDADGAAINNALAPNDCPGHVASDDNPKVCRHCGTHVDEERP